MNETSVSVLEVLRARLTIIFLSFILKHFTHCMVDLWVPGMHTPINFSKSLQIFELFLINIDGNFKFSTIICSYTQKLS